VANAVTGGNIGSGSYQKRNKAIVDYINATGGIAGRKVETVVYYQDSNQKFTSSGRQREYQRMCSTWTEDHRVFVMSGHAIWGDSGVMFDCAAKTKTPIVMNGFQQPISQRHFESMADYWYAPDWFVADSRERAVGRFLLAHGFFAKGARVGVLIEDTPDIREGVERGLKPVLAAAGIKPALEIFYPDNIESPWPNYVLQLQQARVTHIVMSATSGTALSLLFMMRAAEDQGYRPKWGVGSDNAPGDLVDYSAPEEQMANVLGAGWFPGYDLPGEYPPVSDNDQICREVLKKAGQEDKAGQWRDANLSFCESLLFLRAAFQRAEVVSPKGLAAAVAKLADTYPSTVTVGGATRFGPRRHQGVTVGRLVRWDRGARQLKYASGPEPLAG
jgi:ABC-type branched-subunit amino acid transport system substrate-binding protein